MSTDDSKSETKTESSRSRSLTMSDISGADDLQSLSTGEDAKSKGFDTSGPHRKRERESSDCSHKVIEKRRRDRINRCLEELGKIVPIPHKKGVRQSRLEKAEILELTVGYIKKIQQVEPKEEPLDNDVAIHTNNKQGKGKYDSLRENQPQPKCIAHSKNNATFLANKEESCHQEVLDRCLATEERPQVLTGKTAQPLSFPDKNITSATSSKNIKNTLRVLRSRINSRTQEFKSHKTSQPELTTDKHLTAEENVRKGAKRPRKLNPLKSTSSCIMDDTSSTSSSSSDSVEPETDCSISHSSDSGYRSHPLPVSATPLAVNQQTFGIPTYALHPAGTHYIPVILHPSIPLPPMPLVNLGANQILPNGLSSPYGFGLTSGFNFTDAKSTVQYVQNAPFSNMFINSVQNGQEMLPHHDGQPMKFPNNDSDVDVCSNESVSHELFS